MSIYFILFIEFFKIGLFAIGGGLATIPFLYDLAEKYEWIYPEMISDMIAVAESTPGPIGINTATYVGFSAAGIPGGIIASLSLVLPSFLIIIIISGMITRFQENLYVISVFSALRPTVTALVLVAGLQVLEMVIFKSGLSELNENIFSAINIKTSVLFLALSAISVKKRLHPIILIALAAACGIIFKL